MVTVRPFDWNCSLELSPLLVGGQQQATPVSLASIGAELGILLD
jgi:hypothetical protein